MKIKDVNHFEVIIRQSKAFLPNLLKFSRMRGKLYVWRKKLQHSKLFISVF